MLKINRVVIISILVVTQLSLWAQNNTNSPYTRFGYGELADRSFGAGRAMGGIGIGLRSSKQINPMNPASYSAIDSMTFIFDLGVSGQLFWFTDGEGKQKDLNGNLDYMAMQFPIMKGVAVSLGILPYSHVGYNFGEAKTVGEVTYSEQFVGSGGLHEVYGGIGVDIWKKRLSLGANVGYLFGTMDHQRNVVFHSGGDNIVNIQRLEVRDMKLDFGLQYTHPLSRTQRVTVGAVYSPAQKLNTKSYAIRQVGSTSSGGYIEGDTTTNQRFDLPHSYGIGLSYVKDNKLTVGADVLYEQWSKAQFFDRNDEFENRLRVAGGLEYIPDAISRSYFKRMKYRAGAHYSNSYLNVNMTEGGVTNKYGYDEYGVSVGFTFPIPSWYSIDMDRSYVNLSFEYVKVKPELRSMIDEQYFRFTLNFTFNESWFRRLKLE